MRLSNRNILLAIGIVVAVVVTLTTLVFKDRQSAEKIGIPTAPAKKTSLNSTAKRVVDFFTAQVKTHR